jgi:hypothetical protein
MPRLLLLFLLVLSCLMISWAAPLSSEAQVIVGPDVKIINNEIHVSFSLTPDSRHIQEIKDGIEKEYKLDIDLFRVWRGWLDEFVLGKSFYRTLKSDPIKQEYVATSNDGSVLVEKRYRSVESMILGTLSVKDLKLTSTRELDPALYFVRITVESRIRKLPPVIGQFIIFISESEFKTKKDSGSFPLDVMK